MPILDPVNNFAKTQLIPAGLNAGQLIMEVLAGTASLFPNPAVDGNFNVVVYNSTDYSNPSDDPDKELVRITAVAGDIFTITRAQEGTSDNDHNTAGKTYTVAEVLTKKTITDIIAEFLTKLATVSHDSTLGGNGTPGSPLTVIGGGSGGSGSYKSGIITRAITDGSGLQTIPHGLGTTPKKLILIANGLYTSGAGSISQSIAYYDGANTEMIWNDEGNGTAPTQGNSTTDAIRLIDGFHTATVSFDAVNIYLNWTKTGSPSGGGISILWEADLGGSGSGFGNIGFGTPSAWVEGLQSYDGIVVMQFANDGHPTNHLEITDSTLGLPLFLYSGTNTGGGDKLSTAIFPVKKGDVVNITLSTNTTITSQTLYPFTNTGNNSGASGLPITVQDEFIGGENSTIQEISLTNGVGELGWNEWASSPGDTIGHNIDSEVGHQGIFQLEPDGNGSIYLNPVMAMEDGANYRFIFRGNQATQNAYGLLKDFNVAPSGTTPGFFVSPDAGKFISVNTGGTNYEETILTPFVSSNWYEVIFKIVGLSIECWIGINGATPTLVGTHSTYIPSTTDNLYPLYWSGNRTIVAIDYFSMYIPSANAKVSQGGGIDVQTFLADGTWVKPTGAKKVVVKMWGGGGGGDAGGGAYIVSSGGGGGAYNEKEFDASLLGSSENIVVGLGGAQQTAGGVSSFGSLLYAYGGGGGLHTGGTGQAIGAGGGGQLSVGLDANIQNPLSTPSAGSPGFPIVGEGIENAGILQNKNGVFGGGAGSNGEGGNSYYGGGAGGAVNSPGGKSVLGGNGGNGSSGNVNAQNGFFPGGGGGTRTGTGSGTAGLGANGQVIITTYF